MTEGAVRLKSIRPTYRRAGLQLSSTWWLVLAAVELTVEQRLRLAADDVVVIEVAEPVEDGVEPSWVKMPTEMRDQAKAVLGLTHFLSGLAALDADQDQSLVPNTTPAPGSAATSSRPEAAATTLETASADASSTPEATTSTTDAVEGDKAGAPAGVSTLPSETSDAAKEPEAGAAAAPVVAEIVRTEPAKPAPAKARAKPKAPKAEAASAGGTPKAKAKGGAVAAK